MKEAEVDRERERERGLLTIKYMTEGGGGGLARKPLKSVTLHGYMTGWERSTALAGSV